MSDRDKADSTPRFEVLEPARQLAPIVFNSPHSGSEYPAAFLAAARLDKQAIRQSEDIFVDRLFSDVTDHGAPLLRAQFPRAWLDVNREPFELDPRMFDGPLPSFANTRSARVTSGLGTIPRLVADGKAIYGKRLSIADALNRIEAIYVPYHRQLRALLDRTRETFGCAVLIDCHSMPSTVRTSHLRGRPDFVLGDRHGSSCSAALTDAVEAELVRRGYDVSRNRPYAGGFITEHYGRPKDGVHALQLEINRALYLDERRLELTSGYAKLKSDLSELVAHLVRGCADWVLPPREAAE